MTLKDKSRNRYRLRGGGTSHLPTARRLAREGALVVVTDINPIRRARNCVADRI